MCLFMLHYKELLFSLSFSYTKSIWRVRYEIDSLFGHDTSGVLLFLTPRPSGDLHPQGSVGEEFHGSKGTSCLRNPLLEAEEGPVEHLNHSVSGWYQSVPSWADSPDAQSSLPQVQSSRNMSGEKWGEWRSNRAEWGDLALQLLC